MLDHINYRTHKFLAFRKDCGSIPITVVTLTQAYSSYKVVSVRLFEDFLTCI